MNPLSLEPGTRFGGDFVIERRLGEGGMGTVYVARQISTAKQRALKLMNPVLVPDAKSRVRFVEEARVGSRIPSEHVVETVGAGVDEATGAPWIAMELLEGSDLDALVRERGPLDLATLRELVPQLRHALGAAHAAGIVHRDLKPENLFLARSRRQGVAHVLKVLDFGIATALPEKLSATVTSAMGTPFWMAPEQAQVGDSIRPATDVWALGLIVYFLRTGKRYWRSGSDPNRAASPASLLTEMLIEPIEPASLRAAEQTARSVSLSPRFDEWFARCVVRDAMARFRDAEVALLVLEEVLQSEAAIATLAATRDQGADALGVTHASSVVSGSATSRAPSGGRSDAGSWVARSAEAPIGGAGQLAVGGAGQLAVGDAVPARADADDVRLPVARRRFVWAAGVAAIALGIGVVALVSGDAEPAPSVDAAPSLVAPALEPLRKDPVVPSATTSVPTSAAEAPVPMEEHAVPTNAATASTRAAPDVRRASTGGPTSPSRAPSPAPMVAPSPAPTVAPPVDPGSPAPTPEASPEVAPAPPAPPSPSISTVEAGPLWNHDYALQTCPGRCAERGARWTGEWWTTVPNVMSVCQCASP